jgi:hypothetical protein
MTQARRGSFSFPFEAPTLSAPSAAGHHRERWPPDREGLRQREVTERRARGTLPFPPRRARWAGRLGLAVLVLCAVTAVGVATLRPQWVPHPSRAALARARGSVLDLLGRRIVLAAPTAARVSVPPRAVPPDVATPAQVHSAPPPSISDVPIFLVSALPVARADWRDPLKAAVHAKAATNAAHARTRHVSHAVLRRAVGARPTPDEVTRPAVQAAPQPPPVAGAAPAPAPGSLDDLIRKSVQADAKKAQ